MAGKYGLIARHLSQWRGLARKGRLVLPADAAPAFVPLVVEPMASAVPAGTGADAAGIEIEIAGAVLHVAAECSPDRAAALVAALKRVL